MLSSTVILCAALGLAKAHTIFQRVYVNGVDQGWTNGVRYPSYDGPITDVTSTDIICNGGPNPLVTPYSQTVINVPAGATVTGEWHHGLQPNGYNPSDLADPIEISHLGPVMAYMAAVPSALQTDVTGLQWFKIWEDGFDGTNWGVNRLYNAKGLQNVTIPSCIPAGNYFLRLEIIALHPASTYPGAQFYMECAQINVTGGGSTKPATVSFPGAYAGSDPGITINIYYPPVTNYTIPGPSVFTCGGSSPTTTAKTTSATTTSKATTSTTSSTTNVPTTATSTTKVTTSSSTTKTTTAATTTATGTVAQYGQCGGLTYTGSTVCTSPYVCTYSNDYFSQCL
ncbi:hypothetical protein FRB93_007816 [Tulasnella sp. JGI-2019a]|nr:hypothetical protein FRB93_007816 [Tulasnella sp. JGI-2019a]